jgi:hypothetical protein
LRACYQAGIVIVHSVHSVFLRFIVFYCGERCVLLYYEHLFILRVLSMKLTRAITHIRLSDANVSKLAQLDALADAYLHMCQMYTTAFCTDVEPNKFADPWLASPLSARWQRVVIQHAAGIARSWRTNHERARQAYLDDLADYQAQPDPRPPGPTCQEWQTPTLKQRVIQANANVVALEPSEDSSFDYWLRISTLDKGTPIHLPVKLAPYHRRRLDGKRINTSLTLTRKPTGWWLTLTVDEQVAATTTDESPIVGVDVGIANFLTTSTGKRYWRLKRYAVGNYTRHPETTAYHRSEEPRCIPMRHRHATCHGMPATTSATSAAMPPPTAGRFAGARWSAPIASAA